MEQNNNRPPQLEGMKSALAEAAEWIRSLSREELVEETAKARVLCKEQHLTSRKMVDTIIHNKSLTPQQKLVRIDMMKLTEAYLYRKRHPEE